MWAVRLCARTQAAADGEVLQAHGEARLDPLRLAGELHRLESPRQLRQERNLGAPGQVRPETEVLPVAEPEVVVRVVIEKR
jgi:hypothetical protein